MENMYLQIGAAVVLVLTNLATFIKSRSDVSAIRDEREATKVDRDAEFHALKERMLKAEFQTNANKDSIGDFNRRFEDTTNQINLMNRQLAEVLVRIDSITELLKEIQRNGRPA